MPSTRVPRFGRCDRKADRPTNKPTQRGFEKPSASLDAFFQDQAELHFGFCWGLFVSSALVEFASCAFPESMRLDFFGRSAFFFKFAVASSYRFCVPRACIRLPVWQKTPSGTATQTVQTSLVLQIQNRMLELYVVTTMLPMSQVFFKGAKKSFKEGRRVHPWM